MYIVYEARHPTLVSRAIVFVLVGYGLVKAAVAYDPKKGPLVLWVVAGGLAGFGLYSIADARHHRV